MAPDFCCQWKGKFCFCAGSELPSVGFSMAWGVRVVRGVLTLNCSIVVLLMLYRMRCLGSLFSNAVRMPHISLRLGRCLEWQQAG